MEKFEHINELIVALLFWITSHTDYKYPAQEPIIEFVEQNKLSEIACSKPCEILAYTPENIKYKIYLSSNLNPLENVCHRGILLHELFHVLQDEQNAFTNNDSKTKKHLREMDALIKHNIFLSQYGKKILYSNGFAAKFKTDTQNTIYC